MSNWPFPNITDLVLEQRQKTDTDDPELAAWLENLDKELDALIALVTAADDFIRKVEFRKKRLTS